MQFKERMISHIMFACPLKSLANHVTLKHVSNFKKNISRGTKLFHTRLLIADLQSLLDVSCERTDHL